MKGKTFNSIPLFISSHTYPITRSINSIIHCASHPTLLFTTVYKQPDITLGVQQHSPGWRRLAVMAAVQPAVCIGLRVERSKGIWQQAGFTCDWVMTSPALFGDNFWNYDRNANILCLYEAARLFQFFQGSTMYHLNTILGNLTYMLTSTAF